VYFIDTSALLKAYLINENGSETVREAIRLLGRSLFVSDLVAAEAIGVLARKRRAEKLSKADYLGLYRQLAYDMKHTLNVVPVTSATVAKAFERVHAWRDHTAGSVDHIHICTAEFLQSLYPAETVHLMCSDGGFSFIASQLGFEVFDPETDRVANLDVTPLGL
jgi:predicted nucleic acid-binding protein